MKKAVKSKFILPRANNRLWENTRLTDEYKNIEKYSLTIIKGSLSCGKTTSFVNFIKENHYENSYYYSIKDDSIDSNQFWYNICYMLRIKDNEIAKQIKLVDSFEDKELEIYQLIDQLLNILVDFSEEEKFIILDDISPIIKNETIINTLDYFIELLPPTVHLILLTRGEIPFLNLISWKVRKECLIIKRERFILDIEQIEEFYLHQYDILLTHVEAKKIFEETEGWILPIDTIANKINQGMELEEVFNDFNQNLVLVFNYLEYSVLDSISSEKQILKEFLLKTAILEELKVDIVDQLLNFESSSEIIKELIDFGVLIEEARKGVYRYNRLFRRFLRSKGVGEIDYQKLHQRLSQIYLNEKAYNKAIHHILAINQEDKIAKLIINNASTWFKEKNFKLLKDSLFFLSHKIFLEYPELFIYRGELYFQLEEFALALKDFKDAKKIFELLNQRTKIVKALIKITALYCYFSVDKALDYIEQLEKYKLEFNKEEKNRFAEFKIIAQIIKGRFKKAELLLAKFSAKKIRYDELRATILFKRGRLREAKKLLKTIEIDETKEFIFYYTFTLPIVINLFSGEIHQAQEYIWKKAASYRGFIKDISYYYLLDVYQLFSLCKIKDCRKRYLYYLEDRFNFLDGIAWSKIEIFTELILFDAFHGNTKEGLSYAKKALDFAKKRGDIYAEANILSAMAVNYYYLGKLDKAKDYFKMAIDNFRKAGAELHLTINLLKIAEIVYKQENIKEFKSYIKEFIKYFKKNAYGEVLLKSTSTLLRDSSLVISLLNKARKEGIEKNYIGKLFKENKLEKVEQSPFYMLKVHAFGDLRLVRGNKEIRRDEWKRKKAKQLFKLFLIHYGELISKDKICSLLWPDKGTKAAYHNFSVALSSLNKVLEPNRESGKDPYFITRKGSFYGLDKQFACFYDVDLFEGYIKRAKRATDEYIKMNYYQEALDIYQGDFLFKASYQEWINNERQRLENSFLEAADELIQYYYKYQFYAKTIELADRILKIDPYIDNAYLYQIISYDKLGKRSRAIESYKKCKEKLKRELNISPNKQVKKYYKYMTL